MPTAKFIGPYRIHFYSCDGGEPRHVHVGRDEATAKFWLDPVRLQGSRGYSRIELNRIEKLVRWHCTELRRKWNDYFDTR